MGKLAVGMAAVLVAGVSVGCSLLGPQVPKCSDDETLDLVRQIIADSVGASGNNEIPIEVLRNALKIELPHATSLEENIKKYTCKANLVIAVGGGQQKMEIEFTSQLDDKDQHLVHAGGMTGNDQLLLLSAVSQALRASQEQAATQSIAPASTVEPSAQDAAILAAAEMVAPAIEEPAATPEQIAEVTAIRERLFSGAGENGTPKFTDYPVAELYSGPTAKLDTSSEEARTFRTRISESLAKYPVDFAGEYTSAGWGCGTMCGYTTFVSKRTGKIIKGGLGGEFGPDIVKFLPDSEMVIAEGGEVDDDFNSTGNFAFFYRLQNDELVLITKVPVPEEIF